MVLLFSISFVLANAPKAIELLGGVMLVGVWTMDLFGPSGRLQFPSVSQVYAIPWKAQQSADGGLHLPRVVWSPSI